MVDIYNRTVLVTGGASGIGRLMARRFATEGATCVIWDLDEARAGETVAELERVTGRTHHAYRCDVSDREAVYAQADRVRAEVGHVDILVNNAGVVSGKLLLDLPDHSIETTYGVNVLALYWMTKAFLPEMVRRNHGHVVTIASAAAMIGVAKQTDYSASKHAAMGFDEALRMELRQIAPGVKTTVVCPFYIDTGMFTGVQSRFPLLLPILAEDEVARKVVQAVRRNRRRLIMPPFVKLLPITRVLPTRAFDALADFLGVNVSMADFVGRTTPSDVEASTDVPTPARRTGS
jgi:all-trans-retinol dehydrogenase (NAD+)